jgi:hypothetical protein
MRSELLGNGVSRRWLREMACSLPRGSTRNIRESLALATLLFGFEERTTLRNSLTGLVLAFGVIIFILSTWRLSLRRLYLIECEILLHFTLYHGSFHAFPFHSIGSPAQLICRFALNNRHSHRCECEWSSTTRPKLMRVGRLAVSTIVVCRW